MGEVDPDAFETMRSALKTRGGNDFDAIPEPGPRPLTNPEAATSFNSVGLDPNSVYAPAAPAFDEYESNSLVADAASELSGLTDFTGPTAQSDLFRGTVEGAREGPYVSQFLYKNVERGVIERDQQFRPLRSTDYMIDFDNWRAVQEGEIPDGGINRTTPDEPSLSDAGVRLDDKRYPITGRDLATYVGENVSQQPYLNAASILQNSEPDDASQSDTENLELRNLSADSPGSTPIRPGLPVDPNVPDGFVDFVRGGYQSMLGGIRLRQRSADAYGSTGEFSFITFDGVKVTVTVDGVEPTDTFDPPPFG